MEKDKLLKLVNESVSLSEISRKLYGNNSCGNRETIKKYINLYEINTDHFINIVINNNLNSKRELIDILKIDSYFDTTNLKNRLYKEGLKKPICEKCGQDENWHGEHMSLILDHINGKKNDLRIENLRIICPNCNATLPTHGGKNAIIKKKESNLKKRKKQTKIKTSINQRKVKRPSYEVLQKEIKELGYSGTGRKYGVSDNAIRKWLKFYYKYNDSVV